MPLFLGLFTQRTEEYLEFEAPLPDDYEQLLVKIRNNH